MSKLLIFLLEYRRKAAVKQSIEKPVLLNLVLLSTIYVNSDQLLLSQGSEFGYSESA